MAILSMHLVPSFNFDRKMNLFQIACFLEVEIMEKHVTYAFLNFYIQYGKNNNNNNKNSRIRVKIKCTKIKTFIYKIQMYICDKYISIYRRIYLEVYFQSNKEIKKTFLRLISQFIRFRRKLLCHRRFSWKNGKKLQEDLIQARSVENRGVHKFKVD